MNLQKSVLAAIPTSNGERLERRQSLAQCARNLRNTALRTACTACVACVATIVGMGGIKLRNLLIARSASAVAAALLASSAAHAIIPAAERQVLLDLYAQTNGANWTSMPVPWTGAVGTERNWTGVTCKAAQAR